MRQEPLETAYVPASSFRRAIDSVRDMLAEVGLTIISESSYMSCRILYVACPFLLLEALAYDRSTAVFLPVQVIVRPTEGGAQVSWVNLASWPKLRLPVGASRPVNALCRRISQALTPRTPGCSTPV